MNVLFVGLGGFCGAIARYGLDRVVDKRHDHLLATLTVNVLGCLALGAFAAVVVHKETTDLFIRVGFLSSFTTFSTFGMANLTLLQEGRPGTALLNIAGQLVLGIGAAAAGWFIVRA